MIYAYVQSECCNERGAALPGAFVGRDERPVSRHGDWNPWGSGKRATLEMIDLPATAANSYQRECARLEARMRGWA